MSWGQDSADTGWGSSQKEEPRRRDPGSNGGWGTGQNDGSRQRKPDTDSGWGTSQNDGQSKRKFNSDNGGWGSNQNDGPRQRKNDSDGGGWGSSQNDVPRQRKNDSDGGGWGTSQNNGPRQRKNDSDGGGWGTSQNDGPRQRKNDSDGGGWGTSQNDGPRQRKSDSDGGGWGSNQNEGSSHGKSDSDNGGWGTSQNEESGQNDSDRKRFRRNDDGDNEAEPRPAPYRPEELDLDEEAKLQGDGAGENFMRYQDQEVTCLPPDRIKPIEKFEDFLKSDLLLTNIKTQKYGGMTPIQKWSIPAILSNHDLIGCAQTGSGKTAAFLLPILQTILDLKPESGRDEDCQNPYCLIISPTRELANQIHVHANMLSKDSVIKCHVIYGQVSTGHLKSKLSTGCHILVATPGRLKDFVQRGWIGFKNIKFIVLDEGDRLVDEGFSSDIAGFFEHESMPPREERQTLFFSATFKEETQMNARKYLKDNFLFLTVGRVGAANEDIKQEFIQVSRQEKKRELKKILAEVPEEEKTIVFTQTKNAADMLAGFFTALNLSSTSIHGDRLQSQREQAIKAFRKGEKRFLISSPVGNRGLDLPKVALVINYDLPPAIDEYVHRIGRTGRAGHTGRAISFYDQERDAPLIPDLIEILTEAKQEIPEWMKGTENTDTFGTEAEPQNDSGAVADTTATATTDDGWGDSGW